MRADGFHFRRQAPLLGFYLDFVCFRQRLVIEVDGSQHGDDVHVAHDAMRDAILRRAGFRTLRFWNSEVDEDFDGVVQTIQLALHPSPSWGGTADAPHRQGGEAGSVDGRLQGSSAASDIPTLAATRPVPPHKGERGP
jgi:hypothetical protein